MANADWTIRKERHKRAFSRSGHSHQRNDNVILLEVAHLSDPGVRHGEKVDRLG